MNSLSIVYFFVTICVLFTKIESNCIWYGECGPSGKGVDGKYNCKYTGEAIVQKNETFIEIFKELCPHLYKENEEIAACCDTTQILKFNDNLALPRQLLTRCPACFKNFKAFLCDLTCGPNQSDYLLVTQEQEYVTPENETKIEIVELTYHITNTSVTELYNSCKDVQFSASNQKVMDLLCGNTDCSPKAFVEYLGNNTQAPFLFRMNLTDEEYDFNSTLHITPINTTMYDCSGLVVSENFNASACGCSDCEKSCPVPPDPPIENPCKIFNIDCMSILGLVLFFVFLVTFLLTIFISNFRKDSLRINESLVNEGDENENSGILTKKKIDLNQISFIQKFGVKTEKYLEIFFKNLGYFCASNPIKVILTGVLVCLIFSGGFLYFSVQTDPVELWSPENSETRLNKNYYDSHFRPFYRTTQIIIRPTDQTPWIHEIFGLSPVQYAAPFKLEFLQQVLELQNKISSLEGDLLDKDGHRLNKTIKLTDICFAPLKPENSNCTIQSILNYWQNDLENLNKINFDPTFGPDFATEDYITHFETCSKSPTSINDTLGLSCLGTYGGIVPPFVALGNYPKTKHNPEYGNASALIITYIINNHKNDTENLPAMAWEKSVIEFLKNYSNKNMTISFSTERSIQDELDRESKSDISTIFISYMAMFLYITLTLGKYRLPRNNQDRGCFYNLFTIFEQLLVDMKFSLGIIGVIIVVLSVASSIGLFSYFHIKATLIIFEVIPFLVLAVGVDNIFILVQNYQRDTRLENETLEQQISRIVGKVGPSMLLTSTAESLAFLLGALTPMPAVRIFSLYASLAVFIDFILQITVFVSFMTLDCKRELSKRYNILCCLKSSRLNNQQQSNEDDSGILFKLFKKYYAPFLMKKYTRPLVLISFFGLFFTSISIIDKVNIGLDQKLSMPKDSYVLDYFVSLEKYLSVGVPVYFILKNVDDYSSIQTQNLICSTAGCNIDSMLNQINIASLRADYTYISIPANSWIDDYFDWLLSGDCCRVYSNDTNLFCPSSVNDSSCVSCNVKFQDGTTRPVKEDFYKYFKFYINDNPGLKCAKGGHAAYGEAIEIINKDGSYDIGSTFFMAYHKVGVTSKDFIGSLKHANEIAKNITNMMRTYNPNTKIEVIAYSYPYVFYEQYLTIWRDTATNIGVSLIAIFLVCGLLLGFDFYTSFLICLTIVMIIVNMFGAMYLFNIELNAVSLVNLVMTVGISVEFCAHIAREFSISSHGSKINRAKFSIAHMGSSVFSGITLTKILGILILAFSHSQLFQVFYFRMYLSVVVIGATHGLILLPVLLSYIGPSLNKMRLLSETSRSYSTFTYD